MASVSKELKRIEAMERDIEHGIQTLESQNSFTMILFYGLILGIFSSLVATIIYEVLMREMSTLTQGTIGIILIIAIPVLIVLILLEFGKIKKLKTKLNLHLESVRKHKKRIS